MGRELWRYPDPAAAGLLEQIHGHHVYYDELFHAETAEPIWTYLTGGLQFDRERHIELTHTAVQPRFERLEREKNQAVLQRLHGELSNSC